MPLAFDHIGLVVRDLDVVLERLDAVPDSVGPIEEFPQEGTREVYVGGAGRTSRLLLMQPTKADGPYARALSKRGPGLHHVALNVPDLDAYLAQVNGWLLHPASLSTIPNTRTAWLARPGVGCLVEVNEAPADSDADPWITGLKVPVAAELASHSELLERTLGATTSWLDPDRQSAALDVGGRHYRVDDLVGD